MTDPSATKAEAASTGASRHHVFLRAAAMALVVCAVSFGSVLRAADTADPTIPAGAPTGEDGGSFEALVGVGQIDEDLFTTISVGATFHISKLVFGLAVPLQLRVWDREPEDDGVIRAEDWDEVSDYLKVIRFVQFGAPGDLFMGRVGALHGTYVGHGTIVDAYYNSIDMDHYQTGLYAQVNIDQGGGEVMFDNMVDPEIMAFRLYVRPFSFTSLSPVLHRLMVGTTVALDAAAPVGIDLDETGAAVINDDNELVGPTEAVVNYGLDLAFEVYTSDDASIVPYFDLNFLETMGLGVHLGTRLEFAMDETVRFLFRPEYRFVTRQYVASYFNAMYEIERWVFADGQPKLAYLQGLDDGPGRHGVLIDCSLVVGSFFTITGVYEDYQGPDNSNLLLRLGLPSLGKLNLSAVYAKRSFDAFGDLFDLDGAIMAAEVRYQIIPFVNVYGMYARRWVLGDDGVYDTINDYSVGAGVSFEF